MESTYGNRPHQTYSLFHETGLYGAFAIVQNNRLASISPPYPGEFLPIRDHSNFVQRESVHAGGIGGFKGRGVVLEFTWTGLRLDWPSSLAFQSISEDRINKTPTEHAMRYSVAPNVLYNVYSEWSLNTSGWIGRPGRYMWSRIFRTTGPGLRLIAAFARGNALPENCRIGERDPLGALVTPWHIDQLNAAIRNGLDISVDGRPAEENPNSVIVPQQPVPRSTSWLPKWWRMRIR
ncbi:hypothetical protein FHW79_005438 [Azospirillum sp. OGB3]|uniref:hypothetical protein n=1 Tax=Azospirillum sp. OGB3 TaxID=2587012 RepID=UPI0016065122|nr:hypothetical protein [Azospirillum sp. OGB3]MBB3267773.1 hypothetical protein [Azospirillum sp. OGB3]